MSFQSVDPRAYIQTIDPNARKDYVLPEYGQTFIQVHDNGHKMLVGRCVGLKLLTDTTGRVVNWEANIDSGYRQPVTIKRGETWRAPSEWHPLPTEFQPDAAVQNAMLLKEVAELRATLATFATSDTLTEVFMAILPRLESLEAGAAPVLPAEELAQETVLEDDPIADMAQPTPPVTTAPVLQSAGEIPKPKPPVAKPPAKVDPKANAKAAKATPDRPARPFRGGPRGDAK